MSATPIIHRHEPFLVVKAHLHACACLFKFLETCSFKSKKVKHEYKCLLFNKISLKKLLFFHVLFIFERPLDEKLQYTDIKSSSTYKTLCLCVSLVPRPFDDLCDSPIAFICTVWTENIESAFGISIP